MCGLLALAGIETQDLGVAAAFRNAMRKLAHRGPDGSGVWAAPSGQAWLGHRRLSINDVSAAGRQPLVDRSGNVALVCNGEIYNSPVLRAELEALGYRFQSGSDNEVILHGYQAWGDAVVDRLTGMFAFVLWDDQRSRLLAARDRIGIKPLYWAEKGRAIAFASEARPLVALPGFEPEAEILAFGYVLSLGYVPAPFSAWRGVYKLLPGHVLVREAGRAVTIRRYWAPPKEVTHASTDWDALFEGVVADHLLSDVPVGILLSGGLDSVSVAVAAKRLGHRPDAYTACYVGREDAEASVATAVAEHLGLPQRLAPISVNHLLERLRTLSGRLDEPQGYSALITMDHISRAASATHKAVLSGDGGDEVLGGYSWYAELDPAGLAAPSGGVDTGDPCRDFGARSVLHRHAMRLFPRFLPREVEALLAPAALRFGEEEMLAPLAAEFAPRLPLRRALQRIDLLTFCADSVLAKVDRTSMAHGLEVRVPFLDHRIVEWGLSRMPSAEEEHRSKIVLRHYLAGRVPERVLSHPKTGFSLKDVGAFDWEAACDHIAGAALVRNGILTSDFRRVIDSRPQHRPARIWTLLALSLWAEDWMA